MQKIERQAIQLHEIIKIARQAGAEIMAFYANRGERAIRPSYKADRSPLTEADLAAHHCIVAALQSYTPHLPILSEEAPAPPYEIRKTWTQFWLIDPLDGTREFVDGHPDFTVNIALIDEDRVTMGVMYAPVLDVLYYAEAGAGAFKQVQDTVTKIRVDASLSLPLRMATTRSHGSKALESFIERLSASHQISRMARGSALKFGLVAEGAVHVYPRFGPTMEWDIAAGQCIVEAAGGSVVDLAGRPLRYNKPDLHSPRFIALGPPDIPWQQNLPL